MTCRAAEARVSNERCPRGRRPAIVVLIPEGYGVSIALIAIPHCPPALYDKPDLSAKSLYRFKGSSFAHHRHSGLVNSEIRRRCLS